MSGDGFIRAWHAEQLATDYGLPPMGLVMGCPLWGAHFTERFLAFCLPSILASRAALDARGWAMVLFVDDQTRAMVQSQVHDPHIHLRPLPTGMMEALRENGLWKYPLLAAAHNLLIHKAADLGAGFHMQVGDAVYSAGFFERLLALGDQHAAIAHTGLTMMPAALPALGAYRQDDVLAVPPQALGHIGWMNFSHPWASWYITDDLDSMPITHFIHSRGRDRLHIHCTHQNAIWIHPHRCRQVNPHWAGTVDSELPRYMAGSFYIPRLEDEMVCNALVSDEPGGDLPNRCTFADYKKEFWHFIGGNRAFVPYFTTPVAVPIPQDDAFPDLGGLDARFHRLMTRLEEP